MSGDEAAARRARIRRKERREWLVVAAITAGIFLLLAILSFQTHRADAGGFLAGLAWRYMQGVILLMLVFALFTLGLNLEFGFTGLINFGHVAFLGLGAYAASILAWKIGPRVYDATLLEAAGYTLAIVCIAAIGTVAFALLLGVPTLKLREDYLAIVTIGAAEILRLFWLNEEWLTNGPQGLSVRMPGAAWVLDESSGWGRLIGALQGPPLNLGIDRYFSFLLLVGLILVAAFYILFELLARSPWGRVLKAIREDETVAAALGKNVFVYKMQSLILGSLAAATGGVLLAWYQRFITPGSFLPLITFYAWIALVIGGVGNHKGALVGAVLLWGVFEIARNLPAVSALGITTTAGPGQVVIIGVLLILIMMFRPQGAMGRREEMMFAR